MFLAEQNAYCQQKQGHAIRPISKGIGHSTVIGQAQVEVMYALNATDIKDKNTYIDLHVLRAGKDISKHYSRFVELNDSLCDDFNKRNPNARSRPRVFCADGRNSTYWSEYQLTDIYTVRNGRCKKSTTQSLGMTVNEQLAIGEVVTSRLGLQPTFLCALAPGYSEDYQVLS